MQQVGTNGRRSVAHAGQMSGTARKKQRKMERNEADKAEAERRGISVEALRGERARQGEAARAACAPNQITHCNGKMFSDKHDLMRPRNGRR